MSHENIEPENIHWNGGSTPDFVCDNGKSYEVKTIWGNTIVIYIEQFYNIKVPGGCYILAFRKDSLEPVVIPASEIDFSLKTHSGLRIKWNHHRVKRLKRVSIKHILDYCNT
jgi:hypothetical protein